MYKATHEKGDDRAVEEANEQKKKKQSISAEPYLIFFTLEENKNFHLSHTAFVRKNTSVFFSDFETLMHTMAYVFISANYIFTFESHQKNKHHYGLSLSHVKPVTIPKIITFESSEFKHII